MKIRLLFFGFFVLRIFTNDCIAQDPDSVYNKAKFYYDSEEYQLCIPIFTREIERNPGNHLAYLYRGNCYLETGQNNKAIRDYKDALEIKKETELLYNLGNAYEREGMNDSAKYFFHRFTEMEPDIAEGYIRLSVLYMIQETEFSDSAIYYASEAIRAEPENPICYNYLSLAYFSDNRYKNALEAAMTGLSIDSGISVLNRTAGICSFFLKDYSGSIRYFDKAFQINPEDLMVLDYKIQTILVQNSDPGMISNSTEGKISLNGISSGNIKNAEKMTVDGNLHYTSSELSQKFNITPMKMGLDEFFMYYLGSSMLPGYNPYHKSLPASYNNENSAKQVEILEDLLLKNPTDFPLYLTLADLYLEAGAENKYFENRFKYFGFIESIKACGDGLTAETAYIVTDQRHEGEIVANLDYRVRTQNLIKQKKHYYDVLAVTDINNNDLILYFNIDKPYYLLPKKAILKK